MSEPMKMNVKIIAQRKPNTPPDNIAFHMEDQDGCLLESLVFSKDKLGMKKEDEHEVSFSLAQDADMSLQFAPDPDRAMWVNRGTAQKIPSCPTTQPPKNNAVFHAISSEGSTLVAINKNPQKCYYRFSLNFIDPNGSDPNYLYRFDPVGDNQNGGIGTKVDAWSTQSLVIGAVALVAVAALAYAAFN